jgi:bacterial/archaeal transporter family protein
MNKPNGRVAVLVALAVAIFCSSIGDVAISQAMKVAGATPGDWADQARAALNGYLFAGVGLHITFMLLYMFALSREELSFVLPMTALDYVLVTVFAAVWAGEDISAIRWASSILVSGGVALVAKS